MKTFEDLKFSKRHMYKDRTQARMTFEDGSEISIITGVGTYSKPGSYEMKSNRTNRVDGIRGWMSPEQITSHMKYIQKNPMK